MPTTWPPDVEQRAARGAGADHGARLDRVADLQTLRWRHRVCVDDRRPVQRADVAGRHRAAVERAADGDHHLALDERRRVGERQRRQAADLVDLEHRDAGLAVVVDEARVVKRWRRR